MPTLKQDTKPPAEDPVAAWMKSLGFKRTATESTSWWKRTGGTPYFIFDEEAAFFYQAQQAARVDERRELRQLFDALGMTIGASAGSATGCTVKNDFGEEFVFQLDREALGALLGRFNATTGLATAASTNSVAATGAGQNATNTGVAHLQAEQKGKDNAIH